jgi:hypothetical protein
MCINQIDPAWIPDVNDESVLHTLRLLHPKLEAQILLAKQVFMSQNIGSSMLH